MAAELTPLIQNLSLDEAWMDLSGTEALHGAPPAITLAKLQARIEAETGLTVSIGLAVNKFLAKVASELDKPRGFSVIGHEAQAFLAGKPVRILPAWGRRWCEPGEGRLPHRRRPGRTDVKVLAEKWGAHGIRLSALAHGQDYRAVNPNEARKGISCETTFNDDLSPSPTWRTGWRRSVSAWARQARDGATAGRVVTLKLRTTDFRIVTRRRTLPVATQTRRPCSRSAAKLLAREATGRPWRLIGIGLADLIDADLAAGDFFAEGEKKALASERSVDAIRERFGAAAVTSAVY
jgi:DNA polymerase-4